MTMIIWPLLLVLIAMAPAIIGAILRIFLRKVSAPYLSAIIGVIFTLIYSALCRPNRSLANIALSFEAQNISERMANLLVTAGVLFSVFLFASISAIGIQQIDRRK